MPIRLKLSLWYSGVFLLIIALFSTYIYLFFTHREMSSIDSHLKEKGKEVHQAIGVVDIYPLPMQQLVLPDIDVFSSPEVLLQIVDPRGSVLSRSKSLGGQSLPISQEAIYSISNRSEYYETQNLHGTLFRIYYLPLLSNSQLVGVLEVGESLKGVDRSLTNLRLLLAFGAITSATISAIIGWFLAGQTLKPIHRIIETTAEIEREGKLERRIAYTGPPDEIGMLSEQINSMMEKIEKMYRELEESYEAQRRFVADASHELRTPLTSIRGNMEFLRLLYAEKGELSHEAMEDIMEEIERVSRMIHNLLALARADAGYQIQMEEIPLDKWFEDLTQQIRILQTETVQFEHGPLEPLVGLKIRGNSDFLKQIFLILFENAFKYTSIGSVHLSFEKIGKYIRIRVADTGIGISQEEVEHIFDRFYRGGNVRKLPGTGLGLSIAKWVTEKHGGSLEVQSEVGQGTTFFVTLPLL
ncbi:MAG TPA: HAMP domain-containing sensor histidine kinase [Bacillota bacterium]|nr:HAMP domain-containing sensor histidine kinase [Bacillota bacterium]